ncbi:MAG: nuclease-related domain-containing protein [Casimicrobiaceae bacterium]
MLVALLLIIMAGLEWWRYFVPQLPHPWISTAFAMAGVAWAVWTIRSALPMFKQLRLGIEGERTVGLALEHLRAGGCDVFHDLVGQGFNVDHVVIGPAGVFTVETKTRSKPVRGNAQITFDGEQLLVGNLQPDRDPVVQARAQASWVRQVLLESTGRKFEVRPVIVFPGWFIEQTEGSKREIWVLNPKALPDFIGHEPRKLSDEDVRLASFHLARFVRAANAAERH